MGVFEASNMPPSTAKQQLTHFKYLAKCLTLSSLNISRLENTLVRVNMTLLPEEILKGIRGERWDKAASLTNSFFKNVYQNR